MLITLGIAAPAAAQGDPRQNFPQVDTASPHGVDLQSGRFTKEGTDLVIGPLSVDHFVQSRGAGPYGGQQVAKNFATSLHGWSNHYEGPGAGGSTEIVENIYIGKQRITFHLQTNGSFFPFDSGNTGWKMVTSGAAWILTHKSGSEYRFELVSGAPALERRLISNRSANGHELNYTYDTSARLRTVKSNRGYAIVLDYSGNNVTACGYNLTLDEVSASSTCSGSTHKIVYGRDSDGKLTSITALDSSVVNIQYDSPQYAGVYPNCVTLPDSSTCAITNVHDGNQNIAVKEDMVTQQTTAGGEVWNYNHLPVDEQLGNYVPGFGEVRQSFGYMYPPILGQTTATFGNGFIQSLQTPEGTTNYGYSTQAAYAVLMGTGTNATWTGPHYYSVYPSIVVYPEGNSVSFTRDWADNVTERIEKAKPGSSLPDQKTTWTYPTSYQWSSPTICAVADVLCDKPTKITDPEGNETDITYDAAHGGRLTETRPAVGGVRPQKRYTYTARNAMIKSGAAYIAMQPPIYLLTSEAYCKTTAASGNGCVGGAADEVITTYDYGPVSGPNNLLLRGTVVDDGGLNLRTCYTYDALGRKISETQPKGTGSTCP